MKPKPILFKGGMVQAILNTDEQQQPIDPKRPYKWNTRRVVKFPHLSDLDFRIDNPQEWAQVAYEDGGGNWIFWSSDAPDAADFTKKAYPNGEGVVCPYGRPGSQLYVRESWRARRNFDTNRPSDIPPGAEIWYEAGGKLYPSIEDDAQKGKLRPGIFMPRWASRIKLEVTAVRAQRVQDISEGEEAVAEGIYRLYENGRWSYTWAGCEGQPHIHSTARSAFAALWDSINGQPKPIHQTDSRRLCYVSYPWQAGFCVETYRGKPHIIMGNPFVWAVAFRNLPG